MNRESCSKEQGVQAEWISSRPKEDDFETNRAAFREMAEKQRADGATFFRYTVDGQVLWVEGWREPPMKQAEFNPPYTLVQP